MATTPFTSRNTSSKLQSSPNLFPNLENQLHIPPVLRPLLRAYILGYASCTAPRLLSLILRHLDRNRKRGKVGNANEPAKHVFFQSFLRILRGGLELQRFPTACAVLFGGSTLLQIPIRKLLERWVKTLSSSAKSRLSQWMATFLSAYLSLSLLQSKQTPDFIDRVPPNTYDPKTGKAIKSTQYAGRTLGLTLFAFVRALDVIIGSLWQSRSKTRAHEIISYLTDPFLFATSSAVIMWSWFYFPDRLPRNYNNWITTAASVDPRLVNALRLCHQGTIVYGQTNPPNSPALLLQDMCREYGWPLEWGDPAKTIPFPCTIVHMHCGPNCEYHALSRFVRSFKWALQCNLPLNLVLKLKNPSKDALKKAIISSTRSSAFLAAFISLFYYAICLCRTRSQQFGPTRRLFQKLLGIKEKKHHPDFSQSQNLEHSSTVVTSTTSSSILEIDFSSPSTPRNPTGTSTTNPTPTALINAKTQTSQAIDSGLCIAAGCLLCGWSILLESAKGTRRAELSLFVLPRALRTLFDKRYTKDREWIERVVFAGCTVVVFEAVVRGSGRGKLRAPRGVFGRFVGAVMA